MISTGTFSLVVPHTIIWWIWGLAISVPPCSTRCSLMVQIRPDITLLAWRRRKTCNRAVVSKGKSFFFFTVGPQEFLIKYTYELSFTFTLKDTLYSVPIGWSLFNFPLFLSFRQLLLLCKVCFTVSKLSPSVRENCLLSPFFLLHSLFVCIFYVCVCPCMSIIISVCLFISRSMGYHTVIILWLYLYCCQNWSQ